MYIFVSEVLRARPRVADGSYYRSSGYMQIYICMYVYTSVYIRIYVHTHTRARAHTHTHTPS